MIRSAEFQSVDVAAELAAAVRTLSRHRHGAILVWDSRATAEGGVVVDALVSREIVVAVFIPDRLNRLHVGAVVICGDRLDQDFEAAVK